MTVFFVIVLSILSQVVEERGTLAIFLILNNILSIRGKSWGINKATSDFVTLFVVRTFIISVNPIL